METRLLFERSPRWKVRPELDSDEEHELVRVEPGVLGSARATRRTGGAAEAPDRDPPRVLGEAETEDQLRVQGWRRAPVVETKKIAPTSSRSAPLRSSALLGRLLREVEGVLDVEGVLLGKVVLLEPLHGHAEVAVLDVDVVEDGDQALEVPVRLGEHALANRASPCPARWGGRAVATERILGRGLAQLVADPVSA